MKDLNYPSKETVDRLTTELKLKGAHEYTQDWEYEVANVDQLPDHIEFYKNNTRNINEKSTLMRMILEAYNGFVSCGEYEDVYMEPLKEILIKDHRIHKDTITYWSCGDEDLEDCFAISAFMRELRG